MDFNSEELTPPKSPVLGFGWGGLKLSDEIEDFYLDGDAQPEVSSSEGLLDFSSSSNHPRFAVVTPPGPISIFHCKGPVNGKTIFSDSSSCLDKCSSEILKNIQRSRNGPNNKKPKMVEDKEFIDTFYPCSTTTGNVIPENSISTPSYKFFGYNFSTLTEQELKKLFLMCKKRIYTIENMTKTILPYGLGGFPRTHTNHKDSDGANNFLQMRKDILSFLNYLINRENEHETEEPLNRLKKSLEPINSWSSSLQHHCGSKEGNQCTSPEYHFFHLSLELRLSILVLHKFSSQTLHWIITDLLYLAHLRYKLPDLKLTERSPFSCNCLKTLWTIIIKIVNQLDVGGKNFWGILIPILSSTYNTSSDYSFQLWIISHLVHISKPETDGAMDILCSSHTNEIVRNWIQIAGTGSFSIKVIADVQDLLRSITPVWRFDLNLITSFWNYWFTRIDKGSFEVRNLEPYISAPNWLNLVFGLTNPSKRSYHSATLDEHISADAFLNFLQLLIAQINCATMKDWRKTKSSLYNRLNRKTIEGYSEIGLMRLITMLLCLTAVAKDDPVLMSENINELLSYGKDNHQKLLFRGKCTVILLLLSRGQDITSICSSLMKTVDEIMGSITRLPTQRDLIIIYLELLDSIPQYSPNLDIGQSKLFSQTLQSWLASCGPNYVTKTLRILHNIFDSWLLSADSIPTTEKSKVAEIIYSKTEQFLKQSIHSAKTITDSSSTNLSPFGELAADLTFYLKTRNKLDEVNKFFELYVLHPRSPPQIIQTYVNALISHEFFQSTSSVVSEIKLTQAWIRLILLGKSVPIDLTRKVLPDCDNDDGCSDSLLRKYCLFVSSERYELSTKDLSTIFQPVGITVKNLVEKVYDEDTEILAHIVRSCITVLQNITLDKLYTKNIQTGLLNQILEAFAPTFFGKPPWEKLSSQLNGILALHLHELFGVIIGTDTWTHDPFLKRKLSDLYRYAFFGFVKGDDLDDTNPALLIMEKIELLSPPLRSQLLNELMQSFHSLTKDEKLTPRFLMATIGFLKRKMGRTVSWLLQPIIEILVERDGENSSRCITIVANVCCLILGREVFCKEFLPELVEAFGKTLSKHFSFKSQRIFDMFTSLANFGNKKPIVKKFLREKILPLILKHIENSELKQGSGTNYSMRNSFKRLQENLGIQTKVTF